MNINTFFKKLTAFILGIFIIAFGIALSVKANLGVSPISCAPYVFSLKSSFTLGELTILLNTLFIIVQILLLRKKYRLIQLIQLPTVVIFGYFIDLSISMLIDLHASTYQEQLFWCLLSCAVIAFGVLLEIKSALIYLPGEGLAVTIVEVFEKEFGKVKVAIDSSLVTVGVISSFVLTAQLQGIREGTILAALLIGFLVKIYSKKLSFIDTWLGNATQQETLTEPSLDTADSARQ